MNTGNGGNGIKNPMRGTLLRPSLSNPYMFVFEENMHYLGILKNLHHTDIMEGFIIAFKQLAVSTKCMKIFFQIIFY